MRLAWATQWFKGHTVVHSKTLKQKKKGEGGGEEEGGEEEEVEEEAEAEVLAATAYYTYMQKLMQNR